MELLLHFVCDIGCIVKGVGNWGKCRTIRKLNNSNSN